MVDRKLPAGWEWKKLKDIAEINPKFDKTAVNGDIDVSFIPMSNVEESTGKIDLSQTRPLKEVIKGYTPLQDGDLLFAKITPCMENGKIAVAAGLENGLGFASTEFHVIRFGSKVIPDLYRYYLLQMKIRKQAEKNMTGSAGQKRVPTNFIQNLTVPIPPFNTQHKIVAILDKAEATQRLRAEADALMQDLVQSVFLEMFGDPATNPKQWDILTIGDVVEKTQYGTSQKSSERGGGYPCLGMNNLTYKGHFDLSHLKYVELSENEFRKYKLEAGDILFNRTNAPNLVGKTGVITKDTDCVFASYLIRLKVNTQIIVPEYLWAYLNSPFIKQTFTSMCKKAVNQANINATELQRVSIPIPPIDMQKVFAKSVRNLSGFKNITGESSKELLMLQNILMSKAFTGDLIA